MIGAKDVRILSEAVRDLQNARAFYERRQPGLGATFADSQLADLEMLPTYGGMLDER
jgi:hypothetical protein